jgi:rhodanese-related sulfurtransferase
MIRQSRIFNLTAAAGAAAILCISCGLAGPALAGDTPEALAGVKIVSAEEIKDSVAKGGVVVDTRVANEFAEEHIKGALSVPYREKSAKAPDFNAEEDQFDLGKLPSAKDTAVVFYCNGPACWKSYKGAVAALKGGYSTVQWYRSGFPDWKSKGLPVE